MIMWGLAGDLENGRVVKAAPQAGTTALMLLSDEMNLCTIPENDAMGAVTQLIVKHINKP